MTQIQQLKNIFMWEDSLVIEGGFYENLISAEKGQA